MKRRIAWLLLLVLALGCLMPGAQAEEKRVNLLFTHDMHSHLSEQRTEGGLTGGFARLETLIAEQRAQQEATFLLDGGDFSMGTLYQTLYMTDAAELTEMGRLGYDATTFGNHEFDYRAAGLTAMLRAALQNAKDDPTLKLPLLLPSNIDWDKSTDVDAQSLKVAMDEYGASATAVIERGGVRVGLFGLMGSDSIGCAPLAGVTFSDQIAAAKSCVQALKAQQADLIVCLSHSGTWEKLKESEDEQLALAVPEIDVIVSGHTHTALDKPIQHGDTFIVSSGSYTACLGQLALRQKLNGRWRLEDYQLHPTDTDVLQDAQTLEEITKYQGLVDEAYLSRYGLTYAQVLCRNPYSFGTDEEVQSAKPNHALGDLMTDAYIAAVQRAEGESYEPVALAIVPTGVVRGTLPTGQITVADAFNLLSLGIGADQVPGYPLVSMYLTGEELYSLAEVDATVSSLMGGVKLFASGGGWKYSKDRLILSRVMQVWTYGADGKKVTVEDGKLYRVVADLYSAQMLGAVKSQSFGMLSLEPKTADGTPVTDYEAHILHDQNGGELKAWVALAQALQTFGGDSGAGAVPKQYATASKRIVSASVTSLGELLSHPGKVFWVLLSAVAALALIVVIVTLLVRRAAKRRRARNGTRKTSV